MARLVVVSGLPGTGKTTLARALARRLGAACLRVDVVEAPLIAAGVDVGPLGYRAVAALARENLLLDADVVVDLVNPLPLTRALWWDVAAGAGAGCVVLECAVPEEAEHRRRVEERLPDLAGQVVPTWREVVEREYHPWDEKRDGPRTLVDTTEAARALDAALAAVARAADRPNPDAGLSPGVR